MLADKLDKYRRWENKYVDNNIQEIQKLYRDERQRKELERGRVEDKKIILIKSYKESSTTTKLSESSFIYKEIENPEWYIKFVHSLTQTRLFKPPLNYTSLFSRGEQNQDFWKEVVIAFVDEKHNIETSWNSYFIIIYQEGPPYKPYFIAINNQGQVIIGPNKKIVVTHIVGELKVLL